LLQVGLGARGLYGLPRRFPLVYETYKGWESSAQGTALGTRPSAPSLKGWESARLSQPVRLRVAAMPRSQGGALG